MAPRRPNKTHKGRTTNVTPKQLGLPKQSMRKQSSQQRNRSKGRQTTTVESRVTLPGITTDASGSGSLSLLLAFLGLKYAGPQANLSTTWLGKVANCYSLFRIEHLEVCLTGGMGTNTDGQYTVITTSDYLQTQTDPTSLSGNPDALVANVYKVVNKVMPTSILRRQQWFKILRIPADQSLVEVGLEEAAAGKLLVNVSGAPASRTLPAIQLKLRVTFQTPDNSGDAEIPPTTVVHECKHDDSYFDLTGAKNGRMNLPVKVMDKSTDIVKEGNLVVELKDGLITATKVPDDLRPLPAAWDLDNPVGQAVAMGAPL